MSSPVKILKNFLESLAKYDIVSIKDAISRIQSVSEVSEEDIVSIKNAISRIRSASEEDKETERQDKTEKGLVNPITPAELGGTSMLSMDFLGDYDLDFIEKDQSTGSQKPLSEEQLKNKRMLDSVDSIMYDDRVDTNHVHVRSEPVIEILSVRLCNQNDSASDDRAKESRELNGTIIIYDEMDLKREEKFVDFEINSFGGAALTLDGPHVVMSIDKPVINIHISDKVTGQTLISNDSPLLKTTDKAEQHHQFEQLHKITAPGTACSAEVKYLALTFGVYTHVEVKLFKQQVVGSRSNEEDKEDEEDLDIFGTISAAYNFYYSENKVNCVNLFEINEDSKEPRKVKLGLPITVSRSVVAVPAYSPFTIQRIESLLAKGACVDTKVTIKGREPFLLDEPFDEYVYFEIFSILSNPQRISVFPIVEVFSIFIGRQNNKQLSLYGMVNFYGTYGHLNLFERDKTDPFILSPGCNLLPLKRPKYALVPGDSFYVSINLEDVEGRVLIKGIASSTYGIKNRHSHWHDRLLCSVIKCSLERCFATIHYTVFSFALRAMVKIRFLFKGELSTDVCKILGNLVALYGGKYGYRTAYEKLYHRIVLFERDEKNPLEGPYKDFDMELSRHVLAVPHDSSLRIAVDLSCQSSGFTQSLRSTGEFQIGSGVGDGVTIEGDRVGINITIEWDRA